MALLTCDFFSEALQMGTSMSVVLPQVGTDQLAVEHAPSRGQADDAPPVLYLLHGLAGDHTDWVRFTSIERYADRAGLAVIMPPAGRSFYADEVSGHPYWTFLTEELPSVVASFFHVSTRREDTFVAGLSMGGYGAVKMALRQPGRFAAAASMSGPLDLAALMPGRDDLFDRVYGDTFGSDDDLLDLVTHGDPASLPALHLSCGSDDPRRPLTERFADAARAARAPVTTAFPRGDHTWEFWDTMITAIVDWLPLQSP